MEAVWLEQRRQRRFQQLVAPANVHSAVPQPEAATFALKSDERAGCPCAGNALLLNVAADQALLRLPEWQQKAVKESMANNSPWHALLVGSSLLMVMAEPLLLGGMARPPARRAGWRHEARKLPQACVASPQACVASPVTSWQSMRPSFLENHCGHRRQISCVASPATSWQSMRPSFLENHCGPPLALP